VSRGPRALPVLTLFWTARLAIAAFVFDVRPYLTSRFYRLGYQTMNLFFIYLVAVVCLGVTWREECRGYERCARDLDALTSHFSSLLQIAAALQLAVPADVPRTALNWEDDLKRMPLLLREFSQVHALVHFHHSSIFAAITGASRPRWATGGPGLPMAGCRHRHVWRFGASSSSYYSRSHGLGYRPARWPNPASIPVWRAWPESTWGRAGRCQLNGQ